MDQREGHLAKIEWLIGERGMEESGEAEFRNAVSQCDACVKVGKRRDFGVSAITKIVSDELLFHSGLD